MEEITYCDTDVQSKPDNYSRYEPEISYDSEDEQSNESVKNENCQLTNSGNSSSVSKKKIVIDGKNIAFEFVTGFRRNSSLLYLPNEKQIFAKKKKDNHLDRYTCYQKGCKASLLFDSSINQIKKLFNTIHLHPDQLYIYKKMKAMNDMKDYCVTVSKEGYNLTTKQMFKHKCNDVKETANLIDYNRVKRNLNRLKRIACTITKPENKSNKKKEDASGSESDKDILKTSARDHSARVPSPVSSDEGSAASLNENVVDASPKPGPSHTFTEVENPMAFKKIKLTHEVPFTEGYLDESPRKKVFEKRKSQIRRKSPTPPPRPRIVLRKDEGNHICSLCPCVAAMENEYDKIGKAWASELKMMTIEQQIFAKRAIAEILFEGQLGGLNRNTVQLQRTSENDPFVVEGHDYMFEKTETGLNA